MYSVLSCIHRLGRSRERSGCAVSLQHVSLEGTAVVWMFSKWFPILAPYDDSFLGELDRNLTLDRLTRLLWLHTDDLHRSPPFVRKCTRKLETTSRLAEVRYCEETYRDRKLPGNQRIRHRSWISENISVQFLKTKKLYNFYGTYVPVQIWTKAVD